MEALRHPAAVAEVVKFIVQSAKPTRPAEQQGVSEARAEWQREPPGSQCLPQEREQDMSRVERARRALASTCR